MASSADNTESGSLRDHFLVAMPNLKGSFFDHSLTYICEHSADGAMGLVVNTPLKGFSLRAILEQMNLQFSGDIQEQAVLSGGPVQIDRGFVLHDGERSFESTLTVSRDIRLTSSKDIMQAIAEGSGPRHTLVALGYAGWGPGQLEQELSENAWLTVPADPAIIFETPADQRWQAAASQLGIDPNLLTPDAGHA